MTCAYGDDDKKLVSSAYKANLQFSDLGKSDVKMLNRKGDNDNTAPWGTPNLKYLNDESFAFMLT
jgi:hypothetical protein